MTKNKVQVEIIYWLGFTLFSLGSVTMWGVLSGLAFIPQQNKGPIILIVGTVLLIVYTLLKRKSIADKKEES